MKPGHSHRGNGWKYGSFKVLRLVGGLVATGSALACDHSGLPWTFGSA